ncbi:hypothetical protein M8J76_011624 [Diaphorina citri]|nr:hypothetical protein M8J75_002157 [Diaphorina citri]KAI5737261.1 hypothetical protein M8J76_011624 [Diaphorina citri]
MGTTIIALLLVLSTGRHMMAFTSAIDAKPENTSLKFTYGSSDLNGKQNGYENVYNRQLKEKYISARDRGDETSWNEANMVQKLNSTEPDENPYLRKVIAATPNLEQLEAMEYLKLEEIKSLINTIEKIGHEELTSDMTTHLSKYRQDPDAPNLLDDQEDYYTAGLILSISVIVVCCCCIINTLICFFLYLRPYLKLSNR